MWLSQGYDTALMTGDGLPTTALRQRARTDPAVWRCINGGAPSEQAPHYSHAAKRASALVSGGVALAGTGFKLLLGDAVGAPPRRPEMTCEDAGDTGCLCLRVDVTHKWGNRGAKGITAAFDRVTNVLVKRRRLLPDAKSAGRFLRLDAQPCVLPNGGEALTADEVLEAVLVLHADARDRCDAPVPKDVWHWYKAEANQRDKELREALMLRGQAVAAESGGAGAEADAAALEGHKNVFTGAFKSLKAKIAAMYHAKAPPTDWKKFFRGLVRKDGTYDPLAIEEVAEALSEEQGQANNQRADAKGETEPKHVAINPENKKQQTLMNRLSGIFSFRQASAKEAASFTSQRDRRVQAAAGSNAESAARSARRQARLHAPVPAQDERAPAAPYEPDVWRG
jgi:hypothetical protein